MLVTPSILTQEKSEVAHQVKRLTPYYKHFQIDIADGEFVPDWTVQIDDIFDMVTRREFPITDNILLDFDLMVKDSAAAIARLKEFVDAPLVKKNPNPEVSLGLDVVFIHFSTITDFSLKTLHSSLFTVGVALDPDDSVDALMQKFDLSIVPAVQIMTVVPGKQGQPFLPEMLKKIEQLRENNYRNLISIDGAINEQTMPLIMQQKYLPDIIGPGSFFSHAKDDEILERVQLMRSLIGTS